MKQKEKKDSTEKETTAKKKTYIKPRIDIILCEQYCETIPVHFSQQGTGVVDGRETDFEDEDFNDGNFGNFGFTYNAWDDSESYSQRKPYKPTKVWK